MCLLTLNIRSEVFLQMKCRSMYADDDKFKSYRNAQKRKRNERTILSASNRNKGWTKEEIAMVMEHKIPDTELAKQLGRTLSAIGTCRYKQLKLLSIT